MPNSGGGEAFFVNQYAKRIRASGGKQKAPALKSNHPPDTNEETVPLMACLLRLPRFFFFLFLSFFLPSRIRDGTLYRLVFEFEFSTSREKICTSVFYKLTNVNLVISFPSPPCIIVVTFSQNINQLREEGSIIPIFSNRIEMNEFIIDLLKIIYLILL